MSTLTACVTVTTYVLDTSGDRKWVSELLGMQYQMV